jgi:methyl-accepting chemotaxis protein
MFARLGLRARLLLLSIAPVLLLAVLLSAVTTYVLHSLAELQEGQSRAKLIQDHRIEIKQYVDLAMSAIKPIYDASDDNDLQARDRAVAVLKGLYYAPGSYFWGYDGRSVRVFQGNSDERIGESFADFRDPNGVYAIRELIRAGKDGSHYVDYSFSLPGKPQPVPKVGYAQYLAKWDLVIGTSVNLNEIESEVQQARSAFQEHIDDLLEIMIGTAVGLLVLMMIVALLLSRSILGPLLRIKANLDDMAAGEGDLTHRLPVTSSDELGALATSFNRFVAKIHTLVQQVAGTTAQLSTLVGAMASQAQRSERAMDAQRHETDQVATAINQMSAAASEVAQSAQRAAEAARDTDREGQLAKRVVDQSVSQIHKLVGEIRSSGETMDTLRQDVQGIVGVLGVIRSIAEQTNLLALNAAIEAARAGEAGRGFAVVADEVRALASRTQQSTGEIQSMIDSLQAATQGAVGALQNASEMGGQTREQANLAGTSLDAIAELIGTINSMSAQIASAAEEQTAVAEEINRSVHQIVVGVDEVASDAVESARTARQLNELGVQLQHLVGQFKV